MIDLEKLLQKTIQGGNYVKVKKLSKLTALVLIFSLIVGFIMPQSYHAETNLGASIEKPISLKAVGSIDGTFNEPGAQWYQISPADVNKFSHMHLAVDSDQMVYVTVYANKENAKKDITYDQYRTSTYTEPDTSAAVVHFPYAWTGPYYIKVEYYGYDEDMEEMMIDEEVPPGENEFIPAKYTLSTKGEKLKPNADTSSGSDCPVEIGAKGQKGGAELLKSIRQFRDGILSKSEEGKKLSSLYYKSAPFLAVKLVVNKSAREEVYKNLEVLKPLITDLNKGNNSHVISEKEETAINALYDLSVGAVPAKLKAEMESIASKVNIKNLKGKEFADVIAKIGIKLPTQTANKYIVKLKSGKKLSSVKAKARSLSALSVKNNDSLFDDMFVVELDEDHFSGMSAQSKNKAMKATVSQIEKLPDVEYVEKVQTYKALSTDIQSGNQWSLMNTGKNDNVGEGKAGADIGNKKLQDLLKVQKGLKDTLVAVVDTGVDSTLADLNGKVVKGKNYIENNDNTMDDNGHGTHVSGIIAAKANNGYSMEGINQHAKILPVKVLDASGSGDTEQIAHGIKYAADKGAKVINLSLGGSYSRTLEYALKYAADKNVVIVAASGNDGQYGISYPAASKYAISVGATNSWDIVADYSNYGVGLDLVAPGSNIPSLLPDGNVTYLSGTSMAAPHVTAVAGLLLSKNPKLKPNDVRTMLHETSKHIEFVETDNKGSEGGSLIDLIGGGGGGIDIDPDEVTLPQGAELVSGYGRLNAYSIFSKLDLNVKLNAIYDNQNKVTGTTVKGAKIEVKKGSKVIGKATAATNGTFSAKIPVQKNKQQLSIVVTSGKAQTTFKTFVKKGTAPKAPKVSTISNKSTYVTGTAQAGVKVIVKNTSKKVVAQGTADSKGKFKLKLTKKQKAGTKLSVTSQDLAKRVSKSVTVVVKDKIPPAAPKVNKVTTKSTKVTGKAEAGSTVTVKYKGKTIGKAKASKKGNFTIKIKKKPAGATLYVNAKDKAGNISKTVKVKVKKA